MRNTTEELYQYFAGCSPNSNEQIGAEIETSFVTETGSPISVETSQSIFQSLISADWRVVEKKGQLITKLVNQSGDSLLYELGRQNIELASAPDCRERLVPRVQGLLSQLYQCAKLQGAFPLFEPVLETTEDLLVIPDERDATWIEVDGREALRPLATISSVQFTVSTTPDRAIEAINRLGERIGMFLANYPQDEIWHEYIRTSRAQYRSDRYGGPLQFSDLGDYCEKLALHDVIGGGPITNADNSIPLFLRSVWWYFRLRRYEDQLCIEVRPLPRRSDPMIEHQLKMILDIIG